MANVLERLLSLESIVKNRDRKIEQLSDRVEALERLIQGDVPDENGKADEDEDYGEADNDEAYVVRCVRVASAERLRMATPPLYFAEGVEDEWEWVNDIKKAKCFDETKRDVALTLAKTYPIRSKGEVYGRPKFILRARNV